MIRVVHSEIILARLIRGIKDQSSGRPFLQISIRDIMIPPSESEYLFQEMPALLNPGGHSLAN